MSQTKKPTAKASESVKPFSDLLGKVPDERIAEMAGVSVSDVRSVADDPGPQTSGIDLLGATLQARADGEDVPHPPEFDEDEDLDDDTGEVARPAPVPTRAYAGLVISLKRAVMLPSLNSKGHVIEVHQAPSIYRGAMAARILELIRDKDLDAVVRVSG